MVNIPLFLGFYTSQVVQDLFHQQYVFQCHGKSKTGGCVFDLQGKYVFYMNLDKVGPGPSYKWSELQPL